MEFVMHAAKMAVMLIISQYLLLARLRLVAVDDEFERISVKNTNMPLLDFYNAILNKLREGSTHGFEFKA